MVITKIFLLQKELTRSNKKENLKIGKYFSHNSIIQATMFCTISIHWSLKFIHHRISATSITFSFNKNKQKFRHKFIPRVLIFRLSLLQLIYQRIACQYHHHYHHHQGPSNIPHTWFIFVFIFLNFGNRKLVITHCYVYHTKYK